MAAVTISAPAGGTTVARHFAAFGTYTPAGAGNPKPYVYLKSSSGAFVAAAAVTGPGSAWTGVFSLTSDHSNLTLVASVGITAGNSHPITVQDDS